MRHSTQRQLDIFAQVVAYGDLHSCAQELRLPVETVEAELDELENRLGHRLFDRSLAQCVLTPAGRQAITALALLSTQSEGQWNAEEASPTAIAGEELEKILALTDRLAGEYHQPHDRRTIRDAVTEIAAHREEEEPASRQPRGFRPLPSPRGKAPDVPAHNIVLAAHPLIFSHFQDVLAAFEASSAGNGISLRLEGLSDAQVPDLFERGLADIAYFYTLREPAQFASRYAWSERISLFIAADHPLAAADAVFTDDLAEVPYLALDGNNLLRRLTEQALERTGLYCPEAVVESDNLYQLMTLVQQGKGYFAAIGAMARDFDKMRNIYRIPYAQGLPQIEVRQAIRPAMDSDEAVLTLAEYLFR